MKVHRTDVNYLKDILDLSNAFPARRIVLQRADLGREMLVELYVYDLTRGMAKAMSQQLLGTYIEAVYHTAIVFGGIEYFYGAGVQTCYPGTTHHGQPMEIMALGDTELPMETVLVYLESLKEIYTPESYDLFAHNCNNFSQDFATFLVGRGIPEKIRSLPAKVCALLERMPQNQVDVNGSFMQVLETPFGQMLKPQIDASMRSITQAEVPAQNRPPVINSASKSSTTMSSMSSTARAVGTQRYGKVINLTDLSVLQEHTATASDTCATIFFTSSTCAPCKLAYPTFDNLAGEYPQCLFVKVDINAAQDIAARYQIRATPTFITFSKGAKQDEWSGADPNLLKANVEKVIQATFPPHSHLTLKVPTLQFGSMRAVTYAKVPNLDKVMAKLGSAASELDLVGLRTFIEKRESDPKEAPLPDLPRISQKYKHQVLALPVEVRFAAVDLLRCAMVDPRVSGYFAEESQPRTVSTLIEHVNNLKDCPHNLRLVTLHLACNMFSSPLYVRELLTSDDTSIAQLIQLITTSLLDASHPTTRVSSASLAFNLAVANYRVRREEGQDALSEGEQVELAASILETLSDEKSEEAMKAMLLAFGYLIYCAHENGEVFDLCRALDAKHKVLECKAHEAIAKEVASLL